MLQQLTLKHPVVRATLGLPDMEALAAEEPSVEPPSMHHRIPVQTLSPKELLAVSL